MRTSIERRISIFGDNIYTFSISIIFVTFCPPEAKPCEDDPESFCRHCGPCKIIPYYDLCPSYKGDEDEYPAEYFEKSFHCL